MTRAERRSERRRDTRPSQPIIGGIRRRIAHWPVYRFLSRTPAYAICLSAFIFLNAFSGQWSYMGIPGPLDRAMFAAVILLFLLDPRKEYRPHAQWSSLHTAMTVFTAWVAGSALVHGTLFESLGFYALLDRVVIPFLLFCMAPVLLAERTARRLVLFTLVLLGAYLGITACMEMSPLRPYVWPQFIVSDELGIHPDRARGPFLAAEADGMMLVVCFYACLIVMLTSGPWMRAFAAVAMPLCLAGTLLSMTRSVWLGLVVGIILVALVVPALRSLVAAMLAGATALVVLILGSSADLREYLMERLTTQRSLDDRANTNEAGLRIVQESPLTGIGWTNFRKSGTDWVRLDENYPLTNVNIEIHNVPLSRAAELGVFAALLWVIIVIAGPIRTLFEKQTGELLQWRILGIGAMCVWVVPTLMSPNPYPLPNNVLWLFTGVLAARILNVHPPVRTPSTTNSAPALGSIRYADSSQ